MSKNNIINGKNKDRLDAWRIRYYQATGIRPRLEPFNVAPCYFCKRPVWKPTSLHIPLDKHICNGSECFDKLLGYLKRKELNNAK